MYIMQQGIFKDIRGFSLCMVTQACNPVTQEAGREDDDFKTTLDHIINLRTT